MKECWFLFGLGFLGHLHARQARGQDLPGGVGGVSSLNPKSVVPKHRGPKTSHAAGSARGLTASCALKQTLHPERVWGVPVIMVEVQIQCGFNFDFMPCLCGVQVPGWRA